MKTEKVALLTKRQAATVEELKKEYGKSRAVSRHVVGLTYSQYPATKELSTDTLIRALYIGYEVVNTIEDRKRDVKRYFDRFSDDGYRANSRGRSYQSIICETLNLLDIKIEGINDI
ncbi:hypothetical protein P8825_15375 [Shouchella clausii]|uniref:hypothetical protein n=1 Tax=Shouchella clausii TaxID=79880 RepID=UPI002DB9EB8F|nr:hypothetical protein [Shouchella clausii]MEB5480946.1 hypothetical protein [Shouchella clausii]